MAKTKSVEVQMKQILDEFSDKVNDVLDKSATETADESVERLHNTSPGHGDYASGWTVKRLSKGDVVVHNSTNYQLTHLLENSHVIRNKRGTWGRTSRGHGQIVHIKPVETWANKEFQRKIKEGLE